VKKILAALLVTTTASAGGLGRPNIISARGVGFGGAFTAIADDPTALYFNPGGLSDVEPQADVGGELVVGPRSYTPVATDGTKGPKQSATAVAPVPAIGVVGRFNGSDDRPSALTLGAGVWNTFGGQISFPKTGQPALDSTQDAALEATAGAALRISDKLSIGGAVRVGIGLFSLDATMMPFDANVSASGVGLGAALGATVKPTDNIRIGVAWRSPLHISTTGNGTVTMPSGPTPEEIAHDQHWPQQASLGVAVLPEPTIRLAAQVDWTQWSTVHDLVVSFPAAPLLDQTYREDWKDSWTARAGAEFAVSPAVALRGGAYFDSHAVPDRTIERQYLDSNKVGIAVGTSIRAAGWRVDAAIDTVLPSTRSVPNNTTSSAAFPADINKAPGDYSGTLVTFELAVAHPL
jgi:long-chain fatty acid transport protein